ncbi:MAG: phosphotransferase family protein [Congregibacter sp.]
MPRLHESWEPRIAEWLRQNHQIREVSIAGALSGGNANVTLRLDTADGPMILRTPPAAAVSSNSHRGIEREARVLRALSGRARVPDFIAWCDDSAPIGSPFLVSGFVEGAAITEELPEAYADSVDSVNRLGEELVAALGDIHCQPWRELGLEDFGRPDGYLLRQIERWSAVRERDSVRELPQMQALAVWLLDNIPKHAHAALTHNDYHLDNTLCSVHEPRLTAIIDWELATIGDPLADLALLLMFWGDKRAAEPPGFAHVQAVSRRDGVHSRRQLAAAWSEITGISTEHLDFYMCYAFWRLAAIVEGAYMLYHAGKTDTDYARKLEYDVPALLREAAAAARGDW